MPLYYANDFTFEIPASLKDKTHHILASADEGPSDFNIVIARSPIDPTETLDTYAEKLLKELAKALSKYRLLARNTIEVAKLPALQIDYQWANEGQQLSQRQVSFIWDMPEHGPRLVQITATAQGAFTIEHVETLTNLIATLQLRNSFT